MVSLLNIFNPRKLFESVPEAEGDAFAEEPVDYGLDEMFLGEQYPARDLFDGARSRLLNFRASYYKASQHDRKAYDWNARPIPPGHNPRADFIGAPSPIYIPYAARRPCDPVRIARTVVTEYTSLVFGEGRFPKIVSEDPTTEDFMTTLVSEARLPTKMIRARNLGGSSGTVGISWWFANGKLRVRVHAGPTFHVLEWLDPDEFEPAHVTELYQSVKRERDPKTKELRDVRYWNRRDWTLESDIVFVPQVANEEDPKEWVIDEEKSFVHNDGYCHCHWVQNLPEDDDALVDGQCDYQELYEQMDELDITNSVKTSGVQKNLDPTLTTSIDPSDAEAALIQKGSDNSLSLGQGGSAAYLTISSDLVTAGQNAVQSQRASILESARCIIPDPNTIAAAGSSSVALRIVYAPMLKHADLMRDSYGHQLQLMLRNILCSARKLLENGQLCFSLPKRRVVEVVEDLSAEQEEVVSYQERSPGGGDIEVVWGDYFPPNSTDIANTGASLLLSTGSKPILSTETAVRRYAELIGEDPVAEVTRVKQQISDDAAAAQGGMFPPIGNVADPAPEHPNQDLADVDPGAPEDYAPEEDDPDTPMDELEPVRALAKEMTDESIESCEHGSTNRCQKCGITRLRKIARDDNGEVLRDPEGKVIWLIVWKAIGDNKSVNGLDQA